MPRWYCVLLVLSVSACDSSDGESRIERDSGVSDGFKLGPEEITLEAITGDIFAPSCALGRCHAEGVAFAGLVLDTNVIENTVGVVSSTAPPRIRIVPGSPDDSYLVEKIESNSPASGQRMPLTGALPARDIARIRAWISAL